MQFFGYFFPHIGGNEGLTRGNHGRGGFDFNSGTWNCYRGERRGGLHQGESKIGPVPLKSDPDPKENTGVVSWRLVTHQIRRNRKAGQLYVGSRPSLSAPWGRSPHRK